MNFSGLISSFSSVMKTISLADIIDVAIVSWFVHYLLTLLRQHKGMSFVKIGTGIFLVYIFASQYHLRTVTFLIESLMQVAFIAALVIFQPELRKLVEQATNGMLFDIKFLRRKTLEDKEIERLQKAIVAICDGMERMSEKQTGALIVMEKFSSLELIKGSGTAINADITPELIGTIFYDGSPLHDGAVIIHDGRITTAGCVLPLSDNAEISKELGTRHRAALGISEETDAIALVVSEETGTISYAIKGKFKRDVDRQGLYEMLTEHFITPVSEAAEETGPRGFFRRRGK